MLRQLAHRLVVAAVTLVSVACSSNPDGPGTTPPDPATAPRASIDRFSANAGTLFVRSATNGLPGPNVAIEMDQAPFITKGFGPGGQRVSYYNFDIMSDVPVPIYVLIRQGESTPVAGQGNIIDVIPGEAGYNDFWRVVEVTVPSDYVANTVTSVSEIVAAGYPQRQTDMIVNCPVVPEGSTASLRLAGSGGLIQGWYKNQVVFYFSFDEKAITTTAQGLVPVSPIFVSFNINPDQQGGGPPSGFKTETGSDRTHNVIGTVPSDAAYSPLWNVVVYDNADFDTVSDLTTAEAATVLVSSAGLVNCPLVAIE
jgi:hypothetical protein